MRSLLSFLAIPLLLAACAGPTANVIDEDDTTPAASDESPVGDPTAAAEAAREDLALRLGIDAGEIAVESTQAQDWSDSCLGLGGAAESCAAVITPGYAIVMVYNGTEYHYRTDERGTEVREE